MRVTIALLLVPLAQSACGLCHQMNAPSTLELQLESTDWAPGVYEVELRGFGQVAMCALDLPAPQGAVVSCTDGASVELSLDGQRIERVVAEAFDAPSFTATVKRDGQVLSDGRVLPEYSVDEPNGPGCGERSQATVVVAF